MASSCGSDDSGDESQAPAATLGAGEIGQVQVGGAEDLKSKPEIKVPDALPPDKLQSKDLVDGKGAKAAKGDNVTVQYVGVAWSTGSEFDASWESGKPFDFELGKGQVIQGWDEGVAGMREGGRRLLVIPAEQAYGAQGQSPSIGPNETLVFVVDLVKAG
jgi:peptidylprolyl isomerase